MAKIKPLVAVYYADDDDDCAERPAAEIRCCFTGQFSCSRLLISAYFCQFQRSC